MYGELNYQRLIKFITINKVSKISILVCVIYFMTLTDIASDNMSVIMNILLVLAILLLYLFKAITIIKINDYAFESFLIKTKIKRPIGFFNEISPFSLLKDTKRKETFDFFLEQYYSREVDK